MKIVTDNLSKRFNREWIFKNLTYTFEAGNSYAITGPNGSGKSTLLQILWGQMPQSHGTLHYHNNQKEVLIEDIYKSIGIAAPYQELIEEFSLEEMVKFHFRFKSSRGLLSGKEILEQLQLEHAADKRISNFSTGMRQRLKLGLALLSDCPILFLDEPTTNLDQKSIVWYWDLFKKLPAGMLIFIASNQDDEYPKNAVKIDISSYK